MKKIISALFILLIISSCKSYEVSNKTFDSSKDIVILYSNIVSDSDDVFLNIKDTKETILEDTPNVTLVDVGNNLFIDNMNDIEYDYACFGANLISHGLNSAYEYTKNAKFKYLLCTASYNGQTKDYFKETMPYEVVDYDDIKVGYIGVLSPLFIENELKNFVEDSNKQINLYNETEDVFYDTVQCSIDKAKDRGANYIVLLSNFDTDPIYSPYSLEDLISNLSNVDVTINGNMYSNNNEFYLIDKDNKNVLIISNGAQYSCYGKVIISNGLIENTVLN